MLAANCMIEQVQVNVKYLKEQVKENWERKSQLSSEEASYAEAKYRLLYTIYNRYQTRSFLFLCCKGPI